MYSKILVPHAGTPAGDKALNHASQVINLKKGTITLLHVVEQVPLPASMTFSARRQHLEEDLKNVRGKIKTQMHILLESKAVKLRKKRISISVRVVHGYPEDEIIRIANDGDFDLVIMAKRKKLSGKKGILKLSSVPRKILERVTSPVLLVDGEKSKQPCSVVYKVTSGFHSTV